MSDSDALYSKGISPPQSLNAWIVCLSAGLFFFYEFFQLNFFDVINDELRQAFHLNALQLSLMASMYLWANMLFLLPAGILLDRYSPRKIILAAMGLCVLATLGFALSSTFFWAAFFHFLTGIGNAFCFISCVVLVSRWFVPAKQALVIGSIVTLAFLGGMTAHTPLAFLTSHVGWRNALFIDVALGGVFFVWIYARVKDAPNNSPRAKLSNGGRRHYFAAIKNGQNWLAALYTACLNLPIMVLGALWGASYLQTTQQFSAFDASSAVSLIFIGSIIGCPLVGWLSDKCLCRKPFMIASAVMTFLLFMPLIVQMKLGGVGISLLFFLIGFFTSAQILSYPMIAANNPPDQTGSATGFASVLIMGGAALAQVVFGLLMNHQHPSLVSNYSPADFQLAMGLFPVTIAISLIAAFGIRESNKRSTHANG